MSHNKNRKNRNKNSENYKESEKKINHVIEESENDMDEADRILQELDEMEEQGTKDISSKVRDLIKNDKEAIRDYNARIDQDIQKEKNRGENKKEGSYIEESSSEPDEIDYLDDEEFEQEKDEINTSDLDVEIDASVESDTKESKIRHRETENSGIGSRKNKKRRNKSKKNDISAEEQAVTIETDIENESEKEDFLASLDRRTERIVNERLRKKQPNRLKPKENLAQEDEGFISAIRNLAMSGIKNMVVMVSMIALMIILFAAMILDRKNIGEEKNQGVFLEMDTTEIVSLFNDYYTALGNSDINKAREYLEDNSDITDDVLLEKVDEAKVYQEHISDSFEIIDCYVQKGIEENEYVVYFKFELKFKEVETPAVGIFSSYVINASKDEKNPDYKICNVDKLSERYKYMSRMSNCSNVTEIFEQTDKELLEACEKDAALKKIVEALKNIGEGNLETTEGGNESGSEGTVEENTTSSAEIISTGAEE